MVELTDETLVAYVDGQLDARTAAEVEAALAGDPAARATVHRFAESARLAQAAFDEALHREIPEALLRTLEQEPEPAAKVESLAARRVQRRASSLRGGTLGGWALPLAASIALFVGLGGGYAIWDRGGAGLNPGQVIGAIPADTPLHRALETTPSGQALAWEDPEGPLRGEVRPLASFRDRAGHLCREYQAFGRDAEGTHGTIGVACRIEPGTWHQRMSIAARPAGEGVYRPAGLGDGAFDDYLDELMSGPPLDREAERAALEAGRR